MNNRRLRKITDRTLVPLFALTLWSGIELHMTGYFTTHDEWHAWAVAHSVAGVFMAGFIVMHVIQHKEWYKTIFKPLKASKARVRRRVVTLLTIVFAAVIITGLWLLLVVDGGGSHFGLVHFWLGVIASVFAVGHILKRYRQLLHN